MCGKCDKGNTICSQAYRKQVVRGYSSGVRGCKHSIRYYNRHRWKSAEYLSFLFLHSGNCFSERLVWLLRCLSLSIPYEVAESSFFFCSLLFFFYLLLAECSLLSVYWLNADPMHQHHYRFNTDNFRDEFSMTQTVGEPSSSDFTLVQPKIMFRTRAQVEPLDLKECVLRVLTGITYKQKEVHTERDPAGSGNHSSKLATLLKGKKKVIFTYITAWRQKRSRLRFFKNKALLREKYDFRSESGRIFPSLRSFLSEKFVRVSFVASCYKICTCVNFSLS